MQLKLPSSWSLSPPRHVCSLLLVQHSSSTQQRLAGRHSAPQQRFARIKRTTAPRSVIRMGSAANGHSTAPLVFRQLFDGESSTYTYLLADGITKEAILIDPVDLQVERDLQCIDELGLKLLLGVNTHCHADHITGTGKIKKLRPDVKSAISAASGARADVLLKPGDVITFGSHELKCLATPGHTEGCLSFYSSADGGRVFTGDTLLIRGCGRTDFQGGSATTLYHSVHSQLFSLPPGTLVYPAHDYKGRTCSSVAEEAAHNPRLTETEDEFVQTMANLNLPYPKKIDVAAPANLRCGLDD